MQNPFPYPPVEVKKLKGKDIPVVRKSLLEQQGSVCPLCERECTEEQAVLDHDHKGGHIREVLHRGCNAAEGKIMNTMRRYGIQNSLVFLENLMKYQVTHSTSQTGLIHPLHKTPEEKIAATKARAKKKREAAKKLKVK